jgi:hypothetical protein
LGRKNMVTHKFETHTHTTHGDWEGKTWSPTSLRHTHTQHMGIGKEKHGHSQA